MPRRLVQYALGMLGVLIYATVFIELFLRMMAPQPLVPRYVSGGSGGIRDNIHNVAFRQWTPEVDVTVGYNDRGMRDDRPAPGLTKPLGECRVALVGDSYFVGFESDYADIFAKRLEDGLKPDGSRIRVLNFSVSGFGTAENLIAIRDRVAPWRPDLVIMSWHVSDPIDNIRSQLFRVDGGRLVPAARNYLPGVTVSDQLMRVPGYRWLIENSHAYSAIREEVALKVKQLLAASPGTAGEAASEDAVPAAPLPRAASRARQGTSSRDPGPYLPPRTAAYGSAELDRALIVASRDAARAAGAGFLLFEVPVSGDRTTYYGVVETYLGDLAGIEQASPLNRFRAAAASDRKLYLEAGHKHWTPQGNAIAAQAAIAAIRKAGLLDGCRAAA